jgi:hypothetical protein
VGTTAMTLPSTLDPGSFIIPLGVSSPTLKAGPLPTDVISYLDSFDTVHDQFNEIPLTLCAPALPVRTACTTVLTSTSTTVSCPSVTADGQPCATLVETIIKTDTHTPHWPTLNGSFTDLKQTAARLTTETQEAITVQATAEPALEPAAVDPSDDADPAGDSGAQTDGSLTAEATDTLTNPIAAPTEGASSTETAISTSTIPDDTASGSVPETEGASPTFGSGSGSPVADSSAATFTGAGSVALVSGWSVVLVVGMVGLWV